MVNELRHTKQENKLHNFNSKIAFDVIISTPTLIQAITSYRKEITRIRLNVNARVY